VWGLFRMISMERRSSKIESGRRVRISHTRVITHELFLFITIDSEVVMVGLRIVFRMDEDPN